MSEIDLTSLITGKNLVLAGGSFALTTSMRASFKDFFATRAGARLLPLLPVIFGIVGALMGVCDGVTAWQDRVMLGALLGFTAGHVFKMGKQSIMGIGIPEKVEPDEGSSPPPAGGGESGNK